MFYVLIACSMAEKINKYCKNALWLLLVHSTVRIQSEEMNGFDNFDNAVILK